MTQHRYRLGPPDPPHHRGGYCLRTCYCGTCAHYAPAPWPGCLPAASAPGWVDARAALAARRDGRDTPGTH